MLLFVVMMVFLLLIALAVAAPVVARQLRRDKEIESQHRMEEYVRAIQLYQRKFPGQYPPSIKALENSNNLRFLRHQYVDPLTGKKDYRLIHLGEQKTKIHVFFGQELGSMAAGLGSAAGMQSSGGMGVPMAGGATSVTSTNALNSGFGGATIGSAGAQGISGNSSPGGIGAGSTGTPGTSGPMGTTNTGTSTGMFGDDTTGSPIVGVGTSRSGDSVTDPNAQSTYQTWEFWYDPRIEALRQSVNLTGGGVSSQSASSFGQNGVTGQPNSGANGTLGAGGFGGPGGNSSGSGFGNSFGSSGFGSSGPGSSTPGSAPSGSAPGSNTTGTSSPSGTANPNSSTPNPF